MRSSGILMHISSLDGDYGIGTLGREAFAFCDFLKDSGFSAWQVLPINPQGPGFSPYNSLSSFAGNPLFISPEELFKDGLITKSELASFIEKNIGRVDFKIVMPERARLMRKAFSRFKDYDTLESFCEKKGEWVRDYASFMTIREELGGILWQSFPRELRDKSGLSEWRSAHKPEEDYYKFEQYIFSKQWHALRQYANSLGIKLIGDVPIYVSLDSCDVWSAPEIWNLNEHNAPFDVAGCPPDAFSADGQLWGNPTYNWRLLSERGYSWWISRLSHLASMFDTVRLDHFRAFEAYWSIPASSPTAASGHWEKGPGKPFFDAVFHELPNLSLIAEDLGFLTPEVFRLRDECGIPGMRVLQFAFDSDTNNIYLPDKYVENCVVYTGTHDNDTLRGFIETAPAYKLAFARRYLAPDESETLFDAFIRAAWSSCAECAIIPMQDVLNLSSQARMNTPSTVNDRNWRWRMTDNAITSDIAEKFKSLNSKYNRI